MTDEQLERWRRAARLARDAMGTEVAGGSKADRRIVWGADVDPLAWWCLTEAIYDL